MRRKRAVQGSNRFQLHIIDKTLDVLPPAQFRSRHEQCRRSGRHSRATGELLYAAWWWVVIAIAFLSGWLMSKSAQDARAVPRDGWLDTGDRAYMAGGDLFITGRVKDIIIRAGQHIAPHEIEEAVGAIPSYRV